MMKKCSDNKHRCYSLHFFERAIFAALHENPRSMAKILS